MSLTNRRQAAQLESREPGRILQAAMATQAALSPVPTCHSCIAKFRLVLISRPIAAASSTSKPRYSLSDITLPSP